MQFPLGIYQDELVLYGEITHIAAAVLNLDRSMTLFANQSWVFENTASQKGK